MSDLEHRLELLAEVMGYAGVVDDGTGDLRVILDTALAADPHVTAAEVAEIVLQAQADWTAELEYARN